MLTRYCQAPEERLDYEVSFTRWLAEDDSIVSAVAVVTGGTAEVDDIEYEQGLVRVWMTGGELDELNTITVTATTAEGREKSYSFELHIKES